MVLSALTWSTQGARWARHPLATERASDVGRVLTGILLSHKEMMPFAATWIDLEIAILCEINQDKDKYHVI